MKQIQKQTIEWFSGTKSFSKVMAKRGYKTLTIDNKPELNPDVCLNLLNLEIEQEECFIFWASPPCTAFSVASISTHWKGGKNAYIPKSETALLGLKLLEKTIQYISIVRPKIWFIENPRGVMRKVIDDIFRKYGIKDYKRHTVTYCQYGDNRMKPTDIWTNSENWIPKKMCKNGDKCHVSAPRGSKTGTQGLKNAKDRGVIPESIFIEILNSEEVKQEAMQSEARHSSQA